MTGISYRHPVTGRPTPPLPSQEKLHSSLAKYRAYIGGYGSGKTEWGCQEVIAEAERYPGSLIIVCRKFSSDLWDTTMRSFFELLPDVRNPKVGRSDADGKCISRYEGTQRAEVIFPNGSIVLPRHLDDPDRFKSLNLGAAYIDEAIEDGCEYAWSIFKGRLRSRRGSRRAWITSNPGPVSSWINQEFTKPRRNDNLYQMVSASSLENIYLTRDYLEQLLELPDEDLKMYVFGQFIAARGAIFSQFRRDIHVIEPRDIPVDWPKWRAIDYGINHPFVCLWAAVDPEGPALYFYREWVQADLTVEDNCAIVKELSTYEQYVGTVIDPAAKQRQVTTGMPIIDQVRQHLDAVFPGDNDVNAGVTRMRTLLSYDVDRVGRVIRPPKAFIFNTCPELIRQIEGLQYEVRKGQSTGKPLKKDDDAWDAAKYLVLALRDFDTPIEPLDPQPKNIQQQCYEQVQRHQRRRRQMRPAYSLGRFR